MGKSRTILKATDSAEKQIRRQHILSAAEKVMARKGLSKLSVSAVAAEANLAQGTLYLYFKNKEEIVGQLTLKARKLLLQKFHDGIQNATNPLDQIRSIFWSSYQFYSENRLFHELVSFYEGSKEVEETADLSQASHNIHAVVISAIDRAKNHGLVREDLNATHFSYAMWGSCIGVLQLIDVKGDMIEAHLNKSVEAFYEDFIELSMANIIKR